MTEAEIALIHEQAKTVFGEFLAKTDFKAGQIIVIGCSTSEVRGSRIGKDGNSAIAEALYTAVAPLAAENGLYLAFQCCEHLNRSLILEEEAAEKYGYEPVNVVPQLKAGGSFSTAAYHTLEHPVAVEHIKAHAGIDIGDTLIGMHMRDVAVPVRIQTKAIGGAHVVCARTRLKFVGGIRARYDEEQM